MAKIPGVTSEILQKKVLEALEGIGIKASDIMGRGTNVKRITSGKDINPFKPNMLEAMRGADKNMGDALDAFANEAKYIMNANDGELVNFLNNLNTYKSIGGAGVDTQGVGSMMKAMTDLEKAAKDLKTSTDEGAELAKQEMKKILEHQAYGGPFKVPNEKFLGGSMHEEGQLRTGIRQFLQTELDAGRLKLNELDTNRVRQYSGLTEHDPILVFKRVYGEDSYKKAGTFPGAFEIGEDFKHYEKIFRDNMGDEFLKIQNKENIGDGTLVLDESLVYKEPIDDPDIPFNQGGRVGYRIGGLGLAGLYKRLAELLKKKTITVKRGESGTTGASGQGFSEYRGKYFNPPEGGFEGGAADARFYSKLGGKEGKPKVLTAELTPEEIIEGKRLRALDVDDPEIGDIILPESAENKVKVDYLNTLRARIEKMLGMVDYAEGGRVGMWKGSGKKGVGALIKLVDDKFGEGTLKTGDDIARPEAAVEAEETAQAIKDFNFRNPSTKVDLSQYNDEALNRLVDEDIMLRGEADTLSDFGKDYGRVKEIEKRRKEIRDILEAAQKNPELVGGAQEGILTETVQVWEDPVKIRAAMEKAGVKGMALSDAAKKMGYDMSKQKDFFAWEDAIAGGMEGFPKEIKEQVIRAKYGDVVDQRLLDNMLADDNHFRLAEIFATIEQGLKMQEQGMGGEEIVAAIKADIKRKPNAAGGGVGSMFRGV